MPGWGWCVGGLWFFTESEARGACKVCACIKNVFFKTVLDIIFLILNVILLAQHQWFSFLFFFSPTFIYISDHIKWKKKFKIFHFSKKKFLPASSSLIVSIISSIIHSLSCFSFIFQFFMFTLSRMIFLGISLYIFWNVFFFFLSHLLSLSDHFPPFSIVLSANLYIFKFNLIQLVCLPNFWISFSVMCVI